MREWLIKAPFNGAELGRVALLPIPEAGERLARARARFDEWRHSSAWTRSQLLNQVAASLEVQKEDFAKLLCAEAGKPITLARGEVDRALGVLRWAAAEAQRFAGELIRLDAGPTGRPGFGLNQRFPRGVILGVTPFNFPLNLAAHKIAPAIACGCSILIKPSPYTPLITRRFVDLFEALEPGLVQFLATDDSTTAELTRHPDVAMVSFTGSARVGWMIRRQAPEKPMALELGGNAWVTVLADTPEAEFAGIARRIAGAAYGYAGQSCISVQNVAVEQRIWPRFKDQLVQATRQVVYGNPELSNVSCGPVINEQAAARIRLELQRSCRGAEVVQSDALELGGKSSAPGNLISPALVFIEGREQMQTEDSLVQEEIFGPVMVARSFDKLDALIAKINSSRYGLQAGVYTQHWPSIEKMYRECQVGGVVVNDVPTARYDHQPYGGSKESGLGREGIRYAMEEMTEPKFLALSSVVPS